MKAEALKSVLFDPSMRLYALLDGGNVNDLPNRLFKSELESYCLLEGTLEPDVLYQAPFLVRLLPGHDFTDWILDDFVGKNKGIFVHSRATLIDMRKHFSSLVKVHSEDGKPLMFRYYDPRVFRKFLPTCEQEELETMFGEVDRFFVESEDGAMIIRYELEEDGYKSTELDGVAA